MKKALSIALVAALAGGSMMAQAYEKGDFILRVGATTVDPDSDSSGINLPGVPTLHTEVDDDTQLGIIPVYMVTESVGLELLAATPFEHDITLQGKGVNLNAGSTKHLPPTLSLQWYPRAGKNGWQPYVGMGVNYTIFFDEKTDQQLNDTLAAIIGSDPKSTDLNLDNSFGLSAQAGMDIPLGKHWAINAAVWYIDISSNGKVSTDVANVNFKTDIDPFVYNLGIAYRF
ncbi:MAG: outer membrane beta-barrel protein [Pseudomonadales bacterium]|nr:outer membrane beta-barrel protein [Pseudomonadales bacterium]